MRDVYSNSMGTIAATASNSPEEGLFRIRGPSDLELPRIQLRSKNAQPQNYVIFDSEIPEEQLVGRLHTRGWVFQERHLSPRVIQFTDKQIYCECFVECISEQMPAGVLQIAGGLPWKNERPFFSGFPTGIIPQSADWHQATGFWYEIWINGYSGGALTRPTDRLVAISGLAQLFKEKVADVYVAGHWLSSLAESLSWATTMPRDRLRINMPSWSWASVEGHVRFPSLLKPRSSVFNDMNTLHTAISISDVEVSSSLRGPGVDDPAGYITLSGLVGGATLTPMARGGHDLRTQPGDSAGKVINGHFYGDVENLDGLNLEAIHYLVLEVFPHKVDSHIAKLLIIKPLANKANAYERLGLFTLNSRRGLVDLGIRVVRWQNDQEDHEECGVEDPYEVDQHDESRDEVENDGVDIGKAMSDEIDNGTRETDSYSPKHQGLGAGEAEDSELEDPSPEEDAVQTQTDSDDDMLSSDYSEASDSSDSDVGDDDIGDESPEDLEKLAAWIGVTNEEGLTAWIPKSSMSTIQLY